MSEQTPATGLRGARNAMPPDIAVRIAERGLEAAFAERPPYQRNDYLGWIARAKRPETRERRLEQMLDELAGAELYMRMSWRTGRPPVPAGEPRSLESPARR